EPHRLTSRRATERRGMRRVVRRDWAGLRPGARPLETAMMILIARRFLRLVEVEGTVIIWSEIMENRRKPAPPAATLDINCDCKEYV
ncbi:hypothetical protein FE77_14785, partial [Staphylococcus aureus]